MWKSRRIGWLSEKESVALSEIFAPLMNLEMYSRENRAVLFPEWISASSEENSALAEFSPRASTINLFGSAINVQASETTAQSSMTSTKDSEFIFTTELNSHAGRGFSSESISIKAREKSLFILSLSAIFKMFSCFSRVRDAPGLHLLKTAFKFERFTPSSSSFSSENSENKSEGILK